MAAGRLPGGCASITCIVGLSDYSALEGTQGNNRSFTSVTIFSHDRWGVPSGACMAGFVRRCELLPEFWLRWL